MVQDRAIVTMADYNRKSYIVYRTAPFSMTLKDRNPDFKVSHSLTLNISKMAADTVIVTMAGE